MTSPTPSTSAPSGTDETFDAAAIRTAVRGCPGVAGLAGPPDLARSRDEHAGEDGTGEDGTGDDHTGDDGTSDDHTGVQLTDETVEVHVVAAWNHPLADLGEQIGTEVAPLLSGRGLHVYVDDVASPH